MRRRMRLNAYIDALNELKYPDHKKGAIGGAMLDAVSLTSLAMTDLSSRPSAEEEPVRWLPHVRFVNFLAP